MSCGDSFAKKIFGGGKFGHPCKSQSSHCLTHTLHCQSAQISLGENCATFFKEDICPRNYPPPHFVAGVRTGAPPLPFCKWARHGTEGPAHLVGGG